MTPDFLEKLEHAALSIAERESLPADLDDALSPEDMRRFARLFLTEVPVFRAMPILEALDLLMIDWVHDETKKASRTRPESERIVVTLRDRKSGEMRDVALRVYERFWHEMPGSTAGTDIFDLLGRLAGWAFTDVWAALHVALRDRPLPSYEPPEDFEAIKARFTYDYVYATGDAMADIKRKSMAVRAYKEWSAEPDNIAALVWLAYHLAIGTPADPMTDPAFDLLRFLEKAPQGRANWWTKPYRAKAKEALRLVVQKRREWHKETYGHDWEDLEVEDILPFTRALAFLDDRGERRALSKNDALSSVERLFWETLAEKPSKKTRKKKKTSPSVRREAHEDGNEDLAEAFWDMKESMY